MKSILESRLKKLHENCLQEIRICVEAIKEGNDTGDMSISLLYLTKLHLDNDLELEDFKDIDFSKIELPDKYVSYCENDAKYTRKLCLRLRILDLEEEKRKIDKEITEIEEQLGFE